MFQLRAYENAPSLGAHHGALDCRTAGWHRDRIAALFRLSSADVQAAFDHIDSHHEEVMDMYE